MPYEDRNLLVAVDGSPQSRDVLCYLAGMMPREGARFTLLHVLVGIPETLHQGSALEELRRQGLDTESWLERRTKAIHRFMEWAGGFLVESGFASGSIRTLVRERQVGVARDIAAEAGKGYDALVLGRHGMSEVKELILGSIANKLVCHLCQLPVWVVGGCPDPGGILVAMDASPGARRALGHAARIASPVGSRILLLHVLQGLDVSEASSSPDGGEMPWKELAAEEKRRAEEDMSVVFRECLGDLRSRGIDLAKVEARVVLGGYSRALTIIGEALEGGFGTIVVGRRGLSQVQEFFMGSVSNKILQLAKGLAVWVVH